MKKLSLIIIALAAVLFTQCKKEESNTEQTSQDSTRKVPVTFTIANNDGSRTNFSDFLTDPDSPHATINWNKTGVETVYMAVPNLVIKNPLNGVTLFTEECAQMVPLKAECDGSAKLVFKGEINPSFLVDGMSYTLYYFGNQEPEITYVDGKALGCKMSFDGQNGTRENLGNYHAALLDVKVIVPEYDANGVAVSFNLEASAPNFTSITSVAYLDLDGESQLNGTAVTKSLSIEFNDVQNTYTTSYEVASVSLNATTNESFIALCPTAAGTKLECTKGTYTFESGVAANGVYYAFDLETNTIQPLQWQ